MKMQRRRFFKMERGVVVLSRQLQLPPLTGIATATCYTAIAVRSTEGGNLRAVSIM